MSFPRGRGTHWSPFVMSLASSEVLYGGMNKRPEETAPGRWARQAVRVVAVPEACCLEQREGDRRDLGLSHSRQGQLLVSQHSCPRPLFAGCSSCPMGVSWRPRYQAQVLGGHRAATGSLQNPRRQVAPPVPRRQISPPHLLAASGPGQGCSGVRPLQH